ncbi:hypothetical protein ISF6_3525 [Piscinibacter sakaiensis]|uniref:Uncharacterized protein n=1 Tax=Piscinibacter sakaiensis TaxID=1547922 RepID=A0A0K8P5V3_PISS1|nr:hypothetical protein ISF6_3525 [Piscinibacter sakaiensis]
MGESKARARTPERTALDPRRPMRHRTRDGVLARGADGTKNRVKVHTFGAAW